MSVGAAPWEGEDRTGGHGQQQTHSHIFGSSMSTGGESIDHRCACLGNNRDYCVCVCVCVFGEVSKVDVIEQVNTIWEQRHWTRTKAVHLLQRKNSALLDITQPGCSQIHRSLLYNPSSHLRLESTCCPAASRPSPYEDGGQQGEERMLSHPSSSPGVGKDSKASWVLINANYGGAVINLGTPVLADENKTITFFPCVSASSYH